MASTAVSLAKVDLSLLFSKQKWARYLKGDKIPIKIGSGRDRQSRLKKFSRQIRKSRDNLVERHLPRNCEVKGSDPAIGWNFFSSFLSILPFN